MARPAMMVGIIIRVRFDAEPSAQNQFTLQSDFMTGGTRSSQPAGDCGGVVTLNQPVDVNGANLLGRWTHDFFGGVQIHPAKLLRPHRRDSVVTERNPGHV